MPSIVLRGTSCLLWLTSNQRGSCLLGYSTPLSPITRLALVSKPRRRLTLLFAKLARAIIKHNRAVFIIWLAALVLSVPAILQVQSVIVYTETAFNPKSSESSIAQDIVSKEFSINQ